MFKFVKAIYSNTCTIQIFFVEFKINQIFKEISMYIVYMQVL